MLGSLGDTGPGEGTIHEKSLLFNNHRAVVLTSTVQNTVARRFPRSHKVQQRDLSRGDSAVQSERVAPLFPTENVRWRQFLPIVA